MKNNKPWIEDSDPLKDYYGSLTEDDLDKFFGFFCEWSGSVITQKLDVCEIKKGIKLLDFSDNYNEICQFSLYDKICSLMVGGNLYWIPISDKNNILFEKYTPCMIAKTPIKTEIMAYVQRSFLQMQNGGYMIFDSEFRFVGVVVDGYYMLVFIRKEFFNNNVMEKYVENWNKIDDFLDPLLKNDLISRVNGVLS